MADINASEFSYTYIPADGALADLQKRFRVTDHGPQIRNASDGSTVTATPANGAKLFIPRPGETPPFAGARWAPVNANNGESLPAFVKRVQAASEHRGEGCNPDSKDTLLYI